MFRYIIIIILFAHMRNKTNRARLKYKKYSVVEIYLIKYMDILWCLGYKFMTCAMHQKLFTTKRNKYVCMRIYRVTRMKKGPYLNNRAYFISFSK